MSESLFCSHASFNSEPLIGASAASVRSAGVKVWLFRPAGVLLQTGLKWAEMAQKLLVACSKALKCSVWNPAARLKPVPLHRKGRANFQKKQPAVLSLAYTNTCSFL